MLAVMSVRKGAFAQGEVEEIKRGMKEGRKG
jgi:hypothetical protein